MARFNADGEFDSAFAGGGGVAAHDLGGRASVGHAVLDSGGGIVVVVESAAIGKERFGLVRFGADGSFDPTFGDGGVAAGKGAGVTKLALAPGGDLVAGGGKAVARFDAGGERDRSFAGDGAFAFGGPKDFKVHGLAVGGSGSIALAGTGGRHGKHFAVARLKKSGKLERRFGDGGCAVEDLGGEEAAIGVAFQGGKIVAAGRAGGPQRLHRRPRRPRHPRRAGPLPRPLITPAGIGSVRRR